MNEEKNKNTKVVKKVKKRKLKVGYILAFALIIVVLIFVIKLIIPSGGSKYGNRLDGIENITFGDKEEKAIVDKLKTDERVTEAKIDIEGRIINVIYNVTKETSKDDARGIGNETLSVISDEVKGFYDIQYMITKKDEEGTKETITKDDGSTEEITNTEFPIMGYKNRKNGGIVW